jgi:hypothetical protein
MQLYTDIDNIINNIGICGYTQFSIIINTIDTYISTFRNISYIFEYIYMCIQKKIIELLFRITNENENDIIYRINEHCLLAMNICINGLKKYEQSAHFGILNRYLRTSSGYHWNHEVVYSPSMNLCKTFIEINRERMQSIILLYIRKNLSLADKTYDYNLNSSLTELERIGVLDAEISNRIIMNQNNYEDSKLAVSGEYDSLTININYSIGDSQLTFTTMGGGEAAPPLNFSDLHDLTFNAHSKILHSKLVENNSSLANKLLLIGCNEKTINLKYGETKIIDILQGHAPISPYKDDVQLVQAPDQTIQNLCPHSDNEKVVQEHDQTRQNSDPWVD